MDRDQVTKQKIAAAVQAKRSQESAGVINHPSGSDLEMKSLDDVPSVGDYGQPNEVDTMVTPKKESRLPHNSVEGSGGEEEEEELASRRTDQTNSPARSVIGKYETDLELVQTSIKLLEQSNSFELQLYRLEERVLENLVNGGGHAVEAEQKAKEILQVMQRNECNNASSYIGEMNEICKAISSNDFPRALGLAKELLKKVEPLKTHTVLHGVQQANSAENAIVGKDVVLLLGRTGAGKSTTVQYLSGLKMVKKKKGFLNKHIEAESPGPGALQRVVAGSRMRSTTKELIPVEAAFGSRTLVLCDAPGFDDSEGPEEDIIAVAGVVKVLQKAKSIRILALQSSFDFGSKGDGFKGLSVILSKLIQDLDIDKMDAILFGFTRFSEEDDLSGRILGVLDEMPSNDGTALGVVADALRDIADDPLVIDPLNEKDSKRILSKIGKTKPIIPGDLCQSLSLAASQVIENQLQVDLKNLEWALEKNKQDLVTHYFSRIEGLVQLLSSTERFLKQALEGIQADYVKRTEQILEKLTRSIDNENQIEDEDLTQLQVILTLSEQAAATWKGKLENLPTTATVASELMNVFSRHREISLKEFTLDEPKLAVFVTNIKDVNQILKDEQLTLLNTAISEILHERVANLLKEAKAAFNQLYQLNDILKELQNPCFLVAAESQNAYHEILSMLIEELNRHLENPILKQQEFTKADIESLKQSLNWLELLHKSEQIEQLLQKKREMETSPFQHVLAILRATFDRVNTKVQTALKDSAEVMNEKETEHEIKQLASLRDIPQIESLTAESYHATLYAFRHYVENIRKSVETLAATVVSKENRSREDYKRLASQLNRLNYVSGLDNTGIAQQSLLQKIVEEISSAIGILQDRMKRAVKNISRLKKKDLAEIVEVYNSMSDMEPLKAYLPVVAEGMDSIDKEFRKAIIPIHERFDKEFQSTSIEGKKARIKELKNNIPIFQTIQDQLKGAKQLNHRTLLREIDSLTSRFQKLEQEQREHAAQVESDLQLIKSQMVRAEGDEFDTFKDRYQNRKDEAKQSSAEREKQLKELHTAISELTALRNLISQKLENLNLSEQDLTLIDAGDLASFSSELEKLEGEVSTCPPTAKFDFHNSKPLDPRLAFQAISFYEEVANIRSQGNAPFEDDPETKIKEFVLNFTTYQVQVLEFRLEALKKPKDVGPDFEKARDEVLNALEMLQSIESSELHEMLSEMGESRYQKTYRDSLIGDFLEDLTRDIQDVAKKDSNHEELKVLRKVVYELIRIDSYFTPPRSGPNFRNLFDHTDKSIQEDRQSGVQEFRTFLLESEYVGAANTLSQISLTDMKKKDVDGLQRDFNNAVHRYLNVALGIAEDLEPKIEEKEEKEASLNVKKLNEALTKIQALRMSESVRNFLSPSFLRDLDSCSDSIKRMLTETILKGCDRIKTSIHLDSFDQAERWLENLQWFHSKLGSNIDSEKIAEKLKEVNQSLEDLANDIENREAFRDISKWAEYSPKHLVAKLDELHKSRNTSMRYFKAKQEALRNTKECYEKKFDEAKNKPLHEMEIIRDELFRAKEYLPVSHLPHFERCLETLSNRIELERKNDTKQLEQALQELERENQLSFDTVANIYHKTVEVAPLTAMKIGEGVSNRLRTHHGIIIQLLDSDKMDEALAKVPHIRLFAESFREIAGIEAIVNDSLKLIKEKALIYAETVRSPKKHPADKVCVGLRSLEFCLSNDFLKDSHATLVEARECACSFFTSLSSELTEFLDEKNLEKMVQKRLEFLAWKDIYASPELLSDSRLDLLDADKLAQRLNQIASDIKKQLEDHELITDDTRQFAEKRFKHVSQLSHRYSQLLLLLDRKKFAFDFGIDVAKVKTNFTHKIQQLGVRLRQLSLQANLSEQECTEFKDLFELLSDLSKQAVFDPLNLEKDFLLVSRQNILQNASKHRTEIEAISVKSDPDFASIGNHLVEMKKLEQNLLFGGEIRKLIDEALVFFKGKHQKNIGQLCAVLGLSDYGNKLISDHKTLSGEDLRLRREKMQKQDNLDEMLRKLDGDLLSKEKLREAHGHYKTLYDELLKRGLGLLIMPNKLIDEVIEESLAKVREIVKQISRRDGNFSGNLVNNALLPELLACVCAIWTLLNTEHYNEERGNDKMAYVLTPHVAQIVSILRIFGVGYTKDVKDAPTFAPFLRRCLVEVGTGEGKSLILGVTASIFALLGCDVECSCYSDYLSQRDYKAFISVFQSLGIQDCIEYNTFNKICEKVLNEQCNVREQIRNGIISNQIVSAATSGSVPKDKESKRVLLIDEVDVFLSERYYGGMYIPSVQLSGGHFKNVLDYVWSTRSGNLNAAQTGFDSRLSINDFRDGKVPAYNELLKHHGMWQDVLFEAVKDMLQSLKSFRSVHYRVHDDKIQYLDGETYVSNVTHGYQTVWAYYYEFQLSKISAHSLAENAAFLLNCGTFSYAEIPSRFSFIAGVSGTLKTLSSSELEILKGYGIEHKTFMPSVFGENNRTYNPSSDIHIVPRADYYERIRNDIDEKCRAKRAVLVFFEGIGELMKYFESPDSETLRKRSNFQIIAENVTPADREMRIKRAGTEGMVTLLTAAFGRGTDFVCRNPQLLSNGGLHVLQTFYSKEKSEEYQIMGRGARQGDRGSYSMILVNQDLEWLLGPEYEKVIEEEKNAGRPIFKLLEQKREDAYNVQCNSKKLGITQRREEHKRSEAFMEDIRRGRKNEIVMFLKNCNKSTLTSGSASRTIVLMDATGSMSNCLNAAKETVCTMFERASSILVDNGLDPSCFQMRFIVYRNYSSYMTGGLTESSEWESNPSKLREFMLKIRPSGGQGNEAVEAGLAKVVEQNDQVGIDQVILIGDMPPNTLEEVRSRRNWGLVVHLPEAYWETELTKLGSIPVHSFYVAPSAASAFAEIAKRTRGRCEFLDINGPRGAEMLTALITQEVLRKAGGDRGEKLVDDYKRRYSYLS